MSASLEASTAFPFAIAPTTRITHALCCERVAFRCQRSHSERPCRALRVGRDEGHLVTTRAGRARTRFLDCGDERATRPRRADSGGRDQGLREGEIADRPRV